MAVHTLAAALAAACFQVLLAAPPQEAPEVPPPVADTPAAADEHPSSERGPARTIARDFGNLYDLESFARIGAALAVGGLAANTSADQEVRDWYQEDVRSRGTDDFADAVEVVGDDWVGPGLAAIGIVGELVARQPASSGPGGWIRRTGRAALVGLPAVYYLQQVTGGNRPSDGLGSEWEPFDGSHGVSGHTFLGAVPLLTVARMSDNRLVDVLAVAVSTVGGWGRFNDDRHYLSQVFLGWYLAWEATGAVAATEAGAADAAGVRQWAVRPVALPDGGGFQLTWRF